MIRYKETVVSVREVMIGVSNGHDPRKGGEKLEDNKENSSSFTYLLFL